MTNRCMNEFIELVNDMRKAQKQYKLFGTRDAKEHCNMLECEVDFQLRKYIKEDKIFGSYILNNTNIGKILHDILYCAK